MVKAGSLIWTKKVCARTLITEKITCSKNYISFIVIIYVEQFKLFDNRQLFNQFCCIVKVSTWKMLKYIIGQEFRIWFYQNFAKFEKRVLIYWCYFYFIHDEFFFMTPAPTPQCGSLSEMKILPKFHSPHFKWSGACTSKANHYWKLLENWNFSTNSGGRIWGRGSLSLEDYSFFYYIHS